MYYDFDNIRGIDVASFEGDEYLMRKDWAIIDQPISILRHAHAVKDAGHPLESVYAFFVYFPETEELPVEIFILNEQMFGPDVPLFRIRNIYRNPYEHPEQVTYAEIIEKEDDEEIILQNSWSIISDPMVILMMLPHFQAAGFDPMRVTQLIANGITWEGKFIAEAYYASDMPKFDKNQPFKKIYVNK